MVLIRDVCNIVAEKQEAYDAGLPSFSVPRSGPLAESEIRLQAGIEQSVGGCGAFRSTKGINVVLPEMTGVSECKGGSVQNLSEPG